MRTHFILCVHYIRHRTRSPNGGWNNREITNERFSGLPSTLLQSMSLTCFLYNVSSWESLQLFFLPTTQKLCIYFIILTFIVKFQQKKCTAVNFLMGVQDDPVCLLIDRTREGNESEMPIPESVIYSATSFCLNQSNHCILQFKLMKKIPWW